MDKAQKREIRESVRSRTSAAAAWNQDVPTRLSFLANGGRIRASQALMGGDLTGYRVRRAVANSAFARVIDWNVNRAGRAVSRFDQERANWR